MPEETGREWLGRGRGTDPERPATPRYAAFAESVERAVAEVADRQARVIISEAEGRGVCSKRTTRSGRTDTDGKALPDEVTVTEWSARPNWKAAADWLEHALPEEWGNKRHKEHSREVRLKVNVPKFSAKAKMLASILTPAEVAEILRRFESQRRNADSTSCRTPVEIKAQS